MLEGLQVSEIKLSDVLNDNDVFRNDAEYFSKLNIEFENKIKSIGYKKTEEFAFVIDRNTHRHRL